MLPELESMRRADCPRHAAMGRDAGLKKLPDALE